ncbi:MAG: hypothetical protein QNJ34_08835 [Xenococcaceae cyanobacterium MO_188.B29]|nr:hypothetical protein [Xenococcaceae cyanobacterium MO_188.B29]
MSRHKKICITHESKKTEEAKILASYLTKSDYKIIFLCKDRFPIADPMTVFLSNLSSKFDATLYIYRFNPKQPNSFQEKLADRQIPV